MRTLGYTSSKCSKWHIKIAWQVARKKNSLWQCLTRSTFLSNYVLILFQADFLLASRENKWPRRVELSAGEYIMMHNANVMVHFVPNNENENWSGEDSVARPRVVRRGIADIEDEIDDGGWLFVAFPCISINWGLTVETWEVICGFLILLRELMALVLKNLVKKLLLFWIVLTLNPWDCTVCK